MKSKHLTVTELAAAFHVTEKAIRDWTARGMPLARAGAQGRGRRAYYDLGACVDWYFGANHQRLNLEAERARLAKEQADKTALDNELRRGRLVDVEEVAQLWTDLVAAARARLLAMPTKLGPTLVNTPDPAVVAETIRREVYSALDELAQPQEAPGEND